MKKHLILFVISISIIQLFSLEFDENIEFKYDPKDLHGKTGKIEKDANGDACALLLVETDAESDIFLTNVDVIKKEKKADGIYYFYISFRERYVTFTSKGYLPIKYKIPVKMESNSVYVVILKTIEETIELTTFPIKIKVIPENSKVSIDGKEVDFSQTVKTAKGKHTLDIEKIGYEPVRDEIITIDEDNIYFEYSLIKAENVPLVISTEPLGAKIFIDDVSLKGTSPVQDFFHAGKHRIKIIKEKYVDYEDYIEINSPKTEKNYTLQPDFGKVIIKSDPEVNMNFSLNNKYNATTPSILDSIPAIEYVLNAKHPKNLYTIDPFVFTLARGETKIINLTPQINFGSIEISCDPVVQMMIKINNLEKDKTPLKLENIIAGEYTIFAEHELYAVEPITFNLQREEDKKIVLHPQSNFGVIALSSEPEVNLEIYLDEEYKGNTPITIKPVLEGKHTVEAKHKFYLADMINISLKADEEIKKTIIAKQNYGTLTIKTSEGTTVYLNDEVLTKYKNIKLNPQTVYLRAEKNKCETVESQFILKVGDQITEELFPRPNTGTILVTVVPKDAKIELTGDAGEYFSSEGIESFNDIPFGNYILKVTKDNYIEVEEEINLKKDEQIRKDIELKRVNYVFEFNVSSGSERIEDLDFEISLNKKNVYSGKGKKQLSFSESGTYEIKIMKGMDFGFAESFTVGESGNYKIDVINVLGIEKERKQKVYEDFADKIYQYDDEIIILYEGYRFGESKKFRFQNLKQKLMIYFYDNSNAFYVPLLAKAQILDGKISKEYTGSYIAGISILGNITYSNEFVILDFLSINLGFFMRSRNHKNRIIIDLDGGGKLSYGHDLNYQNEIITFVKEISIQDDELKTNYRNFYSWMPLEFSLNFERYLVGKSFLVFRAGFWWFTQTGGSIKYGNWYIKDEIDNWQTGNPLPQPIDGNPDHPVYQGIVPYFGVGIRF